MDLFEEKRVSPMLISQMQEPFKDDKWIYELKELHRNVSERTVLEVNWWCFGMASLTFLNFSGAPC